MFLLLKIHSCSSCLGIFHRSSQCSLFLFKTFVICKTDMTKMASKSVYKEASSIITAWRVSPGVHHQFVSHSVPSIPHLLSFFLCLSMFPFSSQCLSVSDTHTHTHTPEHHESFMRAGCIIPEACSLRPIHTRLHHLERGKAITGNEGKRQSEREGEG